MAQVEHDNSPEAEAALQTAIEGWEAGQKVLDAEAAAKEEAEAPVVETEAPAVEPAPDPEPVVEATGEPAPDTPAPETDPQFQRMAAKEKEVRTQIEQLKAARQELEEAKAQATAFEEAKRKLAADPVQLLRSLDPNIKLAEVAQRAWLEELGDDAPEEAKQNLQQFRQQSEVAQLREEMQRLQSQIEQQGVKSAHEAQISAYESSTKELLAKGAEDLPLLSRLAKKDEKEALDMVMKAAGAMAEVAKYENWDAEEIEEKVNPRAVAAFIEKDLARLSGLLAEESATPPAAPKAKAASSRTLTTKQTQSGRAAAPSDDDLDEEALIQRAIANADFGYGKEEV